METRLQGVIEDILGSEAPAVELNVKTSSTWDSLNHLNLILAIEEEFEIEIAPEDFPTLHSNYAVILDFIKHRLEQ